MIVSTNIYSDCDNFCLSAIKEDGEYTMPSLTIWESDYNKETLIWDNSFFLVNYLYQWTKGVYDTQRILDITGEDFGDLEYAKEELRDMIEHAFEIGVLDKSILDINGNTELKLIKQFETPVRTYLSGEINRANYWAKILGKGTEDFISNYRVGYFDDWFETLNK